MWYLSRPVRPPTHATSAMFTCLMMLEGYFTRQLSGTLPNLCAVSTYLVRGAAISGPLNNVSRARVICSPCLRSPLWQRLRPSQSCCQGEMSMCLRRFLISPKSRSLSPIRAIDQAWAPGFRESKLGHLSPAPSPADHRKQANHPKQSRDLCLPEALALQNQALWEHITAWTN